MLHTPPAMQRTLHPDHWHTPNACRPKNGMDSEGRSTVPPPVPRAKKAGGAGLDGGMTPLEGDRKVEALLGLRKPPPPSNNAGVLSMLPPPPRPPAGSR